MKQITKWILAVFVMLTASTAFSQGKISGTVVDAELNTPLSGVNVIVKGTSTGVSTDAEGKFSIKANSSNGELILTYIGYDKKTVKFTSLSDLGTLKLNAASNQLEEVIVKSTVIDIAKDRKTPVAVSTIKSAEIVQKIGNQEFPEILKNTPSVYTSKGGGGFGDSRINIRGFSQENIAVMINGMPVNDMENGAVYWSNWAGLSDVTSSMQVQRGLGSSKLAIASVGGTVNIVTRSSDMKQGGNISATTGNDSYRKFQASYSTGILKNGLSTSILLSNTDGDGYVNGTKFNGQSYFLGLGYSSPSRKHQIEFTFTGAAQWHHQRNGAITLDQYINKGGNGVEPNIKYNRDWGFLKGEEFNVNRNFYNKPVASINYDFKINETTKISAIAYGSWGRGGGAGAWGKANGANFDDDRWRTAANNGIVDYDKIFAYNSGQTVQFPNATFTTFTPVTRAMVGGQYVNTAGSELTNGISQIAGINSHNWYGSIINFDKKINHFSLDFGIDYRTYKGIHVRYLNNLLGGTTFKDVSDINNPVVYTSETSSASPSLNPFYKAISGTPILRNWEGHVNWIGGFGQVEYSNDNLTAYVQGAVSQQGFKRVDYFVYKNADPLQSTGVKNILGGNIKGGINYNINSIHNVFVNSGYYSKQPFLNSVYPNNKNVENPGLTNEKIIGFEAGYGLRTNKLNVNLNVYRTTWKDRYLRSNDPDSVGNPNGYYDYSGVTEIHQGVEFDMNYKILEKLKLTGMFSFGDWNYSGNSISNRYDANGNNISGGTVTTLYLDGVKVGNTAQMTASLGASYEIIKNLSIDANINYYDKLYASINPSNFSKETNKGSLQLPNYNLVDSGVSFKLPLGKNNAQSLNFRFNMNNVFNKTYIAESSTNIFADDYVSGTSGPTFESAGKTYDGVATANKVYFGFGRTWNFGVSYKF